MILDLCALVFVKAQSSKFKVQKAIHDVNKASEQFREVT